MINLKKLVIQVLKEETAVGDALGAPAGGTSQFSGDFYATGDNRVPYSIYGGVMSRKGLIKGRKKRKKHKKRKK